MNLGVWSDFITWLPSNKIRTLTYSKDCCWKLGQPNLHFTNAFRNDFHHIYKLLIELIRKMHVLILNFLTLRLLCSIRAPKLECHGVSMSKLFRLGLLQSSSHLMTKLKVITLWVGYWVCVFWIFHLLFPCKRILQLRNKFGVNRILILAIVKLRKNK